jgi:hypothetical protein
MAKVDDDKIRMDAAVSMAPRARRTADRNYLLAKDVMLDEISNHPEAPQREYHIDQATRDRLIIHTREDVAHALLNTITLMKDVQNLKQRSRNTRIVIAIFCAAIATWIWWRWPSLYSAFLKAL